MLHCQSLKECIYFILFHVHQVIQHQYLLMYHSTTKSYSVFWRVLHRTTSGSTSWVPWRVGNAGRCQISISRRQVHCRNCRLKVWGATLISGYYIVETYLLAFAIIIAIIVWFLHFTLVTLTRFVTVSTTKVTGALKFTVTILNISKHHWCWPSKWGVTILA